MSVLCSGYGRVKARHTVTVTGLPAIAVVLGLDASLQLVLLDIEVELMEHV